MQWRTSCHLKHKRCVAAWSLALLMSAHSPCAVPAGLASPAPCPPCSSASKKAAVKLPWTPCKAPGGRNPAAGRPFTLTQLEVFLDVQAPLHVPLPKNTSLPEYRCSLSSSPVHGCRGRMATGPVLLWLWWERVALHFSAACSGGT